MRAFLITPFSPERAGSEDPARYRRVQHLVAEAVEAMGLELVHPAEMRAAGVIMEQVRDEILGADVVLAVLTGANPNVMFELGLALESASRPAVLISNVAADILPFDVRQHRVLTYGDLGDPAQFREQLTEAIRRTLELPPRVSLRQPPLDLQRVEPRHGARFYYGARWAALVGRDRELEALQQFVDDSGPFRWWMVIGAGGLGKSRLALEFALRLAGRWRAGFLAQEEWDWRSWRPTRPTLLIADYVSARVEDVRRLALALARRRDLAFPVRLLLLERDFQESQMGERRDAAWYQAFLGVGGDRALITASRHDAPPLQLDPLDVADVEAMVTSFLRTESAAATARQVAASLMQVDPLGRSLSALLMAESLARRPDAPPGSPQELVREMIVRESTQFWRPAGVTAEDEHLLALATLTGGFAVSLLPRVRAEELIPTPRAFRPRRFEVMTGRAASTRVAPLEPDVVGELFTLDLLAPAHDADGWRVEALWRSAWATAPREMAAFLRRAFTDYPEHPALAAIARLAEDWPIGELAAGDDVGPYVAQTLLDVWLLHRTRLIHGHAPLLGDVRAIYDRIEWLRQATGADPRVEVIWVEAQFQLGSMLANARQADEALECYRKLSRALEVSPESRDRINEGRLRLGPNVMQVLAACDRIAEAGALLPELREAARAHPDRLTAAFGELVSAKVLARAYLERDDVRTALQVYRGVADESLVAILDRELLRDLVSVSLLYGHASEIAPEVTRLERRLWGEEDAGSAPAMPEERLLTDLVLARYRLVTEQAFQLGPLLKEVGAVVAREPPEQTLAAVRGEMFYFGLAVADTRRFDELSDVYEAFSAALGAQPHGSLVKAALLRQFVVRLREAEELDAAVGWFGRLTELFEGTRDTAVSEHWSTARTSLIIALLDRGALDAAKVIHEWGAPTVSSMDGASAGREAHAKDALRIMVACRSANDVDSALEVFHRLDVVRLAFPEEAVLLQAKVYGINLLQDLGSDPRVRQVITTSIEQDPALTFS